MSEEKMMRLGQIARKLNVGTATIVESLAKKGYEVENNPNSKITLDQVAMLEKEFKSSALEKEEASHLSIGKRHEPLATEQELPKPEKVVEPTPAPAPVAKAPEPAVEKITTEAPKLEGIKVLGKVDLDKKPTPTPPPAPQPKPSPAPKQEEKKPEPVVSPAPVAPPAPAPKEAEPKLAAPEVAEVVPEELISAKADSLKGLTVLGKIELPVDKNKKKGGPVASSDERGKDKKRPRKRIDSKPGAPNPGGQAPGAANRPQDQRGGRPGQPNKPGGQQQRPGGNPQQRMQKAEPTQKKSKIRLSRLWPDFKAISREERRSQDVISVPSVTVR